MSSFFLFLSWKKSSVSYKTGSNDNFIQGGRNKCYTDERSTQNPSVPCILPFKIAGISYTECLADMTSKFWCPTQVNEDLEYVLGQGNWGYCSSSCPPLSNDTIITSVIEGTKFSSSNLAWKGKWSMSGCVNVQCKLKLRYLHENCHK